MFLINVLLDTIKYTIAHVLYVYRKTNWRHLIKESSNVKMLPKKENANSNTPEKRILQATNLSKFRHKLSQYVTRQSYYNALSTSTTPLPPFILPTIPKLLLASNNRLQQNLYPSHIPHVGNNIPHFPSWKTSLALHSATYSWQSDVSRLIQERRLRFLQPKRYVLFTFLSFNKASFAIQ